MLLLLRLRLRLVSPVLLLLLGVMLMLRLLLWLLLLIVSMVVAGDAWLLNRRSLVPPGSLVLAVAGGHHALLSAGLGDGHGGWSLGRSVHRARGAGARHHSESPVSSPG